MDVNRITESIIGAAIEVHRTMGPGLMEAVYEECLCYELLRRNVGFERQCKLPVHYKNVRLNCGYRLDLLVEGKVVVELKSVDRISSLHEAQLISYMRLGNWHVGLLINFNTLLLKHGIRRRVLNFSEQ